MLLSRATPTLSGQQVGSFTSVAATTMTANTGTISGVAHLTTIMGTGISDSLVLASSTTAASAAAVSNCWAGCVHTSGGVVSGTLAVSNLNVLGTYMTVNATEVVSSNMVVTNFGTGPALSVTQSETGVFGAQPVATFNAGCNVGLVVTNSGGVAVGKSTASYALDVSGVVSATSFVGSGALLTGISSGGSGAGMFKNLVINGDMQINQYWIAGSDIDGSWYAGCGAPGSSGTTQALSTYVCDRWCFFQDGFTGGGICTQGWYNNTLDGNDISTASSILPYSDSGLLYYAMIGRNNQTGTDSTTGKINMRYAFELPDTYQIFGKTVTLSFYYQCGPGFSGSAINFGFIQGAGEGLQRGATTVTNTISSTASPSSSWVRASFTTTLPSITTNNLYLGLFFNYTPAGTATNMDDFIAITGVQLEKGSSMTTFEYVPIATKQNLCSRYYKPLRANDNYMGLNGTSGSMVFPIQLGTTMRSTTLTPIYRSLPIVGAYGVTHAISAITASFSTTTTLYLKVTCSTLSSNTGPLMLAGSTGGISAEM